MDTAEESMSSADLDRPLDATTFEAHAAAGERVCVLFTARWCVAGGLLERLLGAQVLDVPLVSVDVDTHPHLADRFHVQSLPAAVLLCGGERGRLIGAFGPSQLKALVARGLTSDASEIEPPRTRRNR